MKTSEIRKILDDIDSFLPRDYDPTSVEFAFGKAMVLIGNKQVYDNILLVDDTEEIRRLPNGDIYHSRLYHRDGYDIELIYVEVKK